MSTPRRDSKQSPPPPLEDKKRPSPPRPTFSSAVAHDYITIEPHGLQTKVFAYQINNPGDPTYILSAGFHCAPADPKNPQRLDPDIARDALTILAEQHDALRIFSKYVDGKVIQYVKSKSDLEIMSDWPLLHIPVSESKQLGETPPLNRLSEALRKLGKQSLFTSLTDIENPDEFAWCGIQMDLDNYESYFAILINYILVNRKALDQLIEDFAAVYCRVRNNSPLNLRHITPLSEIKSIEAKAREADKWEKYLSFWKLYLAGSVPAQLQHHNESKSFNGQGKQLSLKFDARLVLELREKFATPKGSNLFTLIIAFTKLYIYFRSGGQTDIRVGGIVPTRKEEESVGTLGNFDNAVIFRTTFLHTMPVKTFIDDVARNVKTAIGHQIPANYLPTETGTNNFMVVVNADNEQPFKAARSTLELKSAGIKVKAGPVEIDMGSKVKFERGFVSLDQQFDGSLAGFIQYGDQYDDDYFLEFNQQMINMMRAAISNPEIRIDQLHFLTERDIKTLHSLAMVKKEEKKEEKMESKFGHYAFELLTINAKNNPNKIAAVHHTHTTQQSITYKQLSYKCQLVAAKLQSMGYKPGTTIGISIMRVPGPKETFFLPLIAQFAAMLAGVTYLPLETRKSQSLSDIIEDAKENAKLDGILVDNETESLFDSSFLRIININKILAEAENETLVYKKPELTPNSLMYIRYTSGSSLRRKAVAIHHRCITHLMNSLRSIEIYSSDKVSTSAPLSFDASEYDWILAWLYGAELHYISSNTDEIARVIKQSKITVTTLTADIIKELGDPSNYPSLLDVTTMGSALDPIVQKQWCQSMLKRKLDKRVGKFRNGYGTTETGVAYNVYPYEEKDPRNKLGRVLPGNKMIIVNSTDKTTLVPIGTPGELVHVGPQVGRYLDPILNQQFFRLVRLTPGGRLECIDEKDEKSSDAMPAYFSGDIGYMDREGNIYFQARSAEETVKIGGQLINIDAMNKLLLVDAEHFIQVKIILNESKDKLIAYIVPRDPDARLSPKKLLIHCNKLLFQYGLPSMAVLYEAHYVAKFTLTENGKIDKLKVKDHVMPPRYDEEKSRPKTSTEEKVAETFRFVLGKSDLILNPGDDFTTLGGHSLAIGYLSAQLKTAFNLEDLSLCHELAYKVITELTIEQIAKLIDKKIVRPAQTAAQSQSSTVVQETVNPGSSAVASHHPALSHRI